VGKLNSAFLIGYNRIALKLLTKCNGLMIDIKISVQPERELDMRTMFLFMHHFSKSFKIEI